MEFKIYQDREKTNNTGNVNNDYRILFPQTVAEAVVFKNDFTNSNTLESVIDYLVENNSCVIASEDEPTSIVGNTHWMKIIGTYNNGTIGNIFLAYTLKHILRNHDSTTSITETENVICKNGETVTPVTKDFDGYLAETPGQVTITERGQVVDCYYDEQQYNILYVLSGGTNSANNSSTIYYTEEHTLENASKTYATFSGWYLDSGFASKITKLSKICKDTTLYAKFIETEYGITYILDGGTNASSNPNTITYYQTMDLADATKANCTFDGWYTDSAFTNKVTTLSNINSDVTLYAKFTEISSGGDSGDSGSDDSGNTGSGDNEDTSGRIYLYNYGDECVDVTGGWYGSADSAGSLIKESTYMELKTGGEQSGITSCNVHVETVFNVLGTYANVYVKYSLSGNPEAELLRKVSSSSYAGGDNRFSESTDIATFNDIFPTGMAYSGALSIWSKLTYTEVDESEIIPVYTFPETSLKIYQVWLDTREGSSSDNEGTDSGNSGSSSGDSSGSDSSTEDTNGRTYLYNRGDECTSLTGGWSSTSVSGTVSKNTDHLYMYLPILDGTSAIYPSRLYTNNVFSFSDLSGYTKLCINFSYDGVSGNAEVAGFNDYELGIDSSWLGVINITSTNANLNIENSVNTTDLDIFDTGTSEHIGFVLIPSSSAMTSGQQGSTLKIYQIWLE